MKYSKNPEDWYYTLYFKKDEHDANTIALSIYPDMLDDELGSHNLPKEIAKKLELAGVFTEAELMESVWELKDQSIMDEFTAGAFEQNLILLGFKKSNIN